MNSTESTATDYCRWSVYGLIIAVSLGAMAARVMQVHNGSTRNPSPFLSANDRSRWATIRSLVDEGTYAIDRVVFEAYDKHDEFADRTDQRDPIWYGLDTVFHKSSDGRWHYYSSKPTLLPTVLAGEYWLVQKFTGMTLAEDRFYVVRIMLLLTNVLPLGLALAALAWLAEKYGTTNWGRLFVVAAACGGTYLTTMVVVLNNHLPAAVCTALTLACLLPICWQRQENWWRFAGAGLFAAFAATCELPALAFFAVVAGVLVQQSPRQTLIWFLPPALLVGLAAVGTNYLAHGTWKPPYAQRQDGAVLATATLETALGDGGEKSADHAPSEEEMKQIALDALVKVGLAVSSQSRLEASATPNRWVLTDLPAGERYAVVHDDESGEIKIRRWGNWYEFPGSYWGGGKLQGVDRGEKSHAVYALHCLIGHHGLFSLTPIWLLSVAGVAIGLSGRDRDWRDLSIAVVLISLVVLGFYLSRPQIDRNYGGVSCCLRWLLWLAPLWLMSMLPAVDRLSESRRWCWFCLVLLAISSFSVTYNALQPFSHPWIFEYWEYLGWIKY
jgi:hypothetical protein